MKGILIFYINYIRKKKSNNVNSEIFARVLFSRKAKFRENKSSQNGRITLSFTDIWKLCLSREFLASQICLLTLFAKIKLSRKFPNLQYHNGNQLRLTVTQVCLECKALLYFLTKGFHIWEHDILWRVFCNLLRRIPI